MPDRKPDLAEIIGIAMVAQAVRACRAIGCNAEGRHCFGSHHSPMRCTECPLDDVDAVADAMMSDAPAGEAKA